MSKSLQKRISGKLAKAQGDSFEALFEMQCRAHQIICTRIPNGSKTIRTPKGLQVVRTKSPFDFLITSHLGSAVIDTKTIDAKAFAHNALNANQLYHLSRCGEHMAAGYVVFFRRLEQVVFFSHMQLSRLKRGQSLKAPDGLSLGSGELFDPGLVFETLTKGKS